MAGLNETPSGNRVRISFFGLRNAGKSTLVNAIAGQPIAIVSEVAGTTTDPVSKAMEILPLGPCVITDTAGLDDVGALGAERVQRSLNVLDRTDIAVWVSNGDEVPKDFRDGCERRGTVLLEYRRGDDVDQFKRRIAEVKLADEPRALIADLVKPGDVVICVCPIDESAPKGRLILPQQQVIRELLDSQASALICQPAQLPSFFPSPSIHHIQSPNSSIPKSPNSPIPQSPNHQITQSSNHPIIQSSNHPITQSSNHPITQSSNHPIIQSPNHPIIQSAPVSFVVIDSQSFGQVAPMVPPEVPLTSFSIVFARAKGDLPLYCAGAEAMRRLKDGDVVLIAEGCTHHRQCGDIGTVKLPKWIEGYSRASLKFEFCAGNDFPRDLSRYALVVHCGGCMLTRRVVQARLARCREAGVPVTNYGIAIAACHGIHADPATCMVKREVAK